MHSSLFINNLYVTLLSSTCFEHGVEQSSLLSTGVLCSRLQRAMIPDAVWIQFFLLKMGVLMLETCRV